MVTTIDDMTDAQGWIPLSAEDALAIEPGHYIIGTEFITVGGVRYDPFFRDDDGRQWPIPPDGVWCNRALAGSVATTHSSGTTLIRYYPDEPSGTPGGDTDPLVLELRDPASVPTPDSGDLALFADSDDGLLKTKDSDGTVAGLGTGGGLTNPLTEDLDAGGYTIKGGGEFGLLQLTSGDGAASLAAEGSMISFQNISGAQIAIQPDGVVSITAPIGQRISIGDAVAMGFLPSVDPGVAGDLYTDGTPGPGDPKPLMVSGGPP